MGQVNLAAVAEAAGVSISTASRVLANRGELSVATRTRVLRAAHDLGYARATSARGRPTTLDPRAIEFVCGLFGDHWADESVAGARHAALSRGSDLIMTMERNRPEDDWPARVATRRSSGIVLAIITPTARQLELIGSLNIPIVLLEPPSAPPESLSSISSDVEGGGRAAAEHLLACGYERFLIVRGEPRLRFGRARDDGFRAALAENGVDAVTAIDGDWNGTLHADDVASALEGGGRLGVFAYNDALALSFCRIAQTHGARIPEDLGVVGVDGEARGAAAVPSLTTVAQPLRAMAARAVELVMTQRGDASSAAVRETFPTELVLRGSTSH